MKRNFLLFVLTTAMLLAAYNRGFSQASKLSVVVIDPGHGGKDPGAVGKSSMEKNIVLALALKLGKLIKDKYPAIKVIYTRSTDEFIELYRRAKIANENKADLFISIHCNSSKSPEPYGSETYVMGINKTKANLEVARKENASILYEENYSKRYEGYDPYSPEATIIFSLYQNLFLDQSLELATRIQKNFSKSFSQLDRGVKQAGFLVLYNVTMPGVLVEAGFVSNHEEEMLLLSPDGQQKVAKAIFKAFCEYKSYKEGKSSGDNDLKADNDDIDTITVKHEVPKVVKKPDTIAKRIQHKIQPLTDTLQANSKVFFKIQFLVSPTKLPSNSGKFKGLKGVSLYKENNSFKYTFGEYDNWKEASEQLFLLKNKGFKDAFIVAIENGKRVSLEAAKKKLKRN